MVKFIAKWIVSRPWIEGALSGVRGDLLRIEGRQKDLSAELLEVIDFVNNPKAYCGDCKNKYSRLTFRSFIIGPTYVPCCTALKSDDGFTGRELHRGRFTVRRDANCPGYEPPDLKPGPFVEVDGQDGPKKPKGKR